ncbi:hypothetical protein SAY87_001819 [Trapa incisa]|uniref:Uncharacterized protein n=2 Tax=Trapa TaxID=22665 RepID=A0AAN7QF48_TRANT|nr:hypothetical protein SAY87_001819 [Trapa incisa]KAK4765604.1 hypothetical protein SAY86_026694 [Trapa natans]
MAGLIHLFEGRERRRRKNLSFLSGCFSKKKQRKREGGAITSNSKTSGVIVHQFQLEKLLEQLRHVLWFTFSSYTLCLPYNTAIPRLKGAVEDRGARILAPIS